MEVHDEPVTLFDLYVLLIEKSAAALVIEHTRDLVLHLPLLILLIDQK